MMRWKRTVDGSERVAEISEAEPGIVHITVELLEQLLSDAGWERVA